MRNLTTLGMTFSQGLKRSLVGIVLVLMFVGIAGAEHEDRSIADHIGNDVYRGQCNDDRSPTEMTHATARVANAFGVQVKACRVDGDMNAWADPRYAGVIWYTKSLVDEIQKYYVRNYRQVLEFIAAHEIGHLVHFTWGRVRESQGQTITEPPEIHSLPSITLRPATSCGFLLFDPVACANWHRITWQATVNSQINVVNGVLAVWRHWFEVDQSTLEHDRRSEMFADCIAGSHLARMAEGLDMVARAVLTAVIEIGAETPHGTHPTPLDRLTATYHGTAGVHFDTLDIVDWCEGLLEVDTRLD